MNAFCLPIWDELPDFELYMDQVISLVGKYLDLFPHDENSDPIVTPSTINNYVRMKIMPAPVKKRYTRVHLAYLIIICTLKQSLNISVVSKIIPMNISEDEVRLELLQLIQIDFLKCGTFDVVDIVVEMIAICFGATFISCFNHIKRKERRK